MLIEKHFILLEKIYKRKERIADAYRVDETDVDPFFLNFFWTFSLKKKTKSSDLVKDLNMQHSLSKTLNMTTTKQNNLLICRQNYTSTSMLFILNFVVEIMEQYRNLSQSSYIPTPEPVKITSFQQSALFFQHYKDYIAEGVRVRFGIRLPNIFIQKLSSEFVTFSEIDLRFNEMERIYQNLTFLTNYVNSFPLTYPSLVVN